MNELQWTNESPKRPGHYWYQHPASHEHPTLVRAEHGSAGLALFFPGIPMPVPVAMLSDGRWATALGP